jgi:hypothetical protein
MAESTKECMQSECMQSECMQSECMQSECTICLLDYKEETKTETECNHTFSQKCLDKLLKKIMSCPLCRTRLQQEQQYETIETSVTFGTTAQVILPRSHNYNDGMYIHLTLPPHISNNIKTEIVDNKTEID